jgi:hypothetical protein
VGFVVDLWLCVCVGGGGGVDVLYLGVFLGSLPFLSTMTHTACSMKKVLLCNQTSIEMLR